MWNSERGLLRSRWLLFLGVRRRIVDLQLQKRRRIVRDSDRSSLSRRRRDSPSYPDADGIINTNCDLDTDASSGHIHQNEERGHGTGRPYKMAVYGASGVGKVADVDLWASGMNVIMLAAILSVIPATPSGRHTLHIPPANPNLDQAPKIPLTACDSNTQVQCSSDGGKTWGAFFHSPCDTKLASLCH